MPRFLVNFLPNSAKYYDRLSISIIPENLLPFYRQLLVWNNFQTDVAHLAINDQQGVVFMVMRRPVSGLDYSEFRHNIDKISAVTLNVIFKLKQQFGV